MPIEKNNKIKFISPYAWVFDQNKKHFTATYRLQFVTNVNLAQTIIKASALPF